MPVNFDDLVPQIAPSGGVKFDDLIPSFGERLTKPVAPLIPSRTPDQFNVLPMRKTGPPGQWDWDPQAGILGVLQRALTSPGDVARGTVPTPYGGNPEPSSDALSRATETATLMTGVSPSYMAGSRFGAPPVPQALPKPPTIAEIQAAADAGVNRAAPGKVPILTQAEREELLRTSRGNYAAAEAAQNAKPDSSRLQSGLKWYGQTAASNDPLTALVTSLPGIAYSMGSGDWKGLLFSGALRGGGQLAKLAANAMARGQPRVAEELARRNSPLGQSLLENLPLSPSRPPPVGRDQAIMQSLIPGLLEDRQFPIDYRLDTSRLGFGLNIP